MRARAMRAASILAGGAASARASRPSLLASVLQAASSHFPNASTRRRDGPAAPAQNIRWRRDPKPRDFASRGARDAKKGEAQKIKSKAMDRLRPPRPALTFGEKGLALTHTPPTYASHVALYLYDADGKKRFLDADRNELLAPGETGGALSVQGGHRQDVYLDDVGGAGEFSATVCYRSLNGFAFSPESPRSNTVVVALPAAPCAPLLEPITRSTVKITVAAPAFCPRISVKVDGAQAAGRRRRRRLRRRTRDEEAAAGRPHRFTGHRYG